MDLVKGQGLQYEVGSPEVQLGRKLEWTLGAAVHQFTDCAKGLSFGVIGITHQWDKKDTYTHIQVLNNTHR